MPATTGSYSGNESIIYNRIISAGYNNAAACGILANLYAESGFNPSNMQNSYEGIYNDSSYTSGVNDGSYPKSKFINDSIGYGLAQWTYWSVKQDLYDYMITKNRKSIGDLTYQISFLLSVLGGYGSENYSELNNILKKVDNTSDGAYKAGYEFCRLFEKPKDGKTAWETRGNSASTTFWKAHSSGSTSSKPVNNLGQRIVQIAKTTLGKEYIWGGEMYDTNMRGADCSGLVYYCYKEAGVDIGRNTADGYYQQFKNSKRSVSPSDVAAADLLFYENNSSSAGLDHIAIANGSGGRIHAANTSRGIVEDSGLGNPNYILRILSDAETSQGEVLAGGGSSGGDSGDNDYSSGSLSAVDYISLTSYDPYANDMKQNLSRVEAVGYDYGYLIDMDRGGEFKFYIPEFTEQAGANWNPISIRGRSVTVQSYESTNSRTITVSLDLYAGVGIYDATTTGETMEENVSRLHKDANFVKSLEYPDWKSVV